LDSVLSVKVIVGGRRQSLFKKAKMANADYVLQLASRAKNPNKSVLARQNALGKLRGFRTYYLRGKKLAAAEYLTLEIKEIQHLLYGEKTNGDSEAGE